VGGGGGHVNAPMGNVRILFETAFVFAKRQDRLEPQAVLLCLVFVGEVFFETGSLAFRNNETNVLVEFGLVPDGIGQMKRTSGAKGAELWPQEIGHPS